MSSNLASSGLSEATIFSIQSVFARYPDVECVLLYGSRAKGNYRNGSDIDLTIVGNGFTHSLLVKLENDLDELLTPYSFDLSIFSDIESPSLIDHISRVGVKFYVKGERP